MFNLKSLFGFHRAAKPSDSLDLKGHDLPDGLEIGRHAFPPEKVLRAWGIIRPEERLVSAKRVFDSGHQPEWWIYGYELSIRSRDGITRAQMVREKSAISMGLDVEHQAQREFRKLKKLSDSGIPILRPYGVYKAAIYGAFIEDGACDEQLHKLWLDEGDSHPASEEVKNLMSQLVHIGETLDSVGMHFAGFPQSLLFNKKSGRFLIADGGSDLVEGATVDCSNLVTLKAVFPQRAELIDRLHAGD